MCINVCVSRSPRAEPALPPHRQTISGYVEVTMDINYEGFGDQSGALKRKIREALNTSRLGSIPVNSQFFSFAEHGTAGMAGGCHGERSCLG